MEKLLEYLKKQREERVKKLDAYTEALDELEAAQKKVDAFGDMGGIEGEIDELDVFIEKVAGRIATGNSPVVAMTVLNPVAAEGDMESATTVGEEEVEGVVDEVVATCEA